MTDDPTNSDTGATQKVIHSPFVKRLQKEKMNEIQCKIEAFIVRREAIASKLRRIKDLLNQGAAARSITVHHLDTYLRRVDCCYDEYNAIQNEVYTAFPNQRAEQEDYFIEFEELYEDLRVEICVALEAQRRITAAASTAQASQVVRQPSQTVVHHQPGLPHVPLPVFEGDYDKWTRFKQLFSDLMQKYPNMSDATKLHYLTQSLKGKAENVISEQILNENNFQAAWNVLVERFENKRTIVDVHINGLLSLKKMTKESSAELRQLVDECHRHVEALDFHEQKMLGLSEALIVSLLTSKLDKTTLGHWETSLEPKQLPKYQETIRFLQNRCFILERCEASSVSKSIDVPKPKPAAGRAPVKVHAALQASEDVCTICDSSHNVNKCNTFKQLELPDRWAKVKDKQLCYNCLKRGHRVGQCTSRVCTVSGCGKKHHTQLHNESAPAGKVQQAESKPDPKTDEQKKETAQAQPTTSTIVACARTTLTAQKRDKQVILSTAVVEVKDSHGVYHPCRVLLDSGSQSNFLSERIMKLLRLKGEAVRIPVVGINGESLTVHRQTEAEVKSLNHQDNWMLEFLVVPQVTGVLPSRRIDTRSWDLPESKVLADPKFDMPARVDMLIGAEVFFDLLLPERIEATSRQPTLWRTKLGWIVSGSYTDVQRPTTVQRVNHVQVPGLNLEHMVQRFWEQEELRDEDNTTEENDLCLTHFAETHRRDADGRYIVRLPFRSNVEKLGNTRSIAEKRFLQLEKRFKHQPDLKALYIAFINEYVALGHCKRLEEVKNGNSDSFYLPHHAILRPSSSTTKLRVVFDGSARSDTGLALNDVLMTGPVQQDTLLAIVLRFRKHKYVYTADVIKMYRQIRVDQRDCRYQRILWRENTKDELSTYELETVTYGTSCAPFCATVCLKQLSIDEESRFPIAAKVARSDVYMDDVLSGGDDLDEVLECQRQLIALLRSGGFELHKWCANATQLLNHIPEKDREKHTILEQSDSSDAIKTLGLLWDPTHDVFLFRIDDVNCSDLPTTKRSALSDTAKIFDPTGVLEPVTIVAKVFIQELWLLQLEWDDDLPESYDARWNRFKADVLQLNELTIPRRAVADDAVSYEVHGFSDASKKAFGACVYLRTLKSDGSAQMHLLCSKTRVAPLPKKPGSRKGAKPFTIPRAELCGALLLARLMKMVIDYLDMQIERVVLWCDSQIVLCWLNKSPFCMEVYVANRVRTINTLTADYEWRYINTKCNPADLASRGVTAAELKQSRLWWNGPDMLHTANYQYQPMELATFSNEELELKTSNYTHIAIQKDPSELLTKYSNYRRLQRVLAYIYRFISNCRTQNLSERQKGPLTITELRRATIKIVAQTQEEGFADELRAIKGKRFNNCKLLQLAPFLDDEGLLRVGGRLKHAKVSYDRKHQLLLPGNHHVTKILIETLHREHLHIGQRGLLAIVRQRYWPVRGKDLVRQIVHKCIRCFRMKRAEIEQYMGNLPSYRVNPAPAFHSTGIDYAGPFYIRQGIRGAKKVKAYVALFICMSTKAIHLEPVSDLTTEAFLGALHRFVGRRGCPTELHSDNATNFQGAKSELHELYELFKTQQTTDAISRFCTAREIQWSFIPPRSPNFGGIWEAGVKAAKKLLKPVLCEASLNYEELNTVLVQIESILNSRPLTEMSSDPTDLSPLTPGHFLVGHELTAVPEPGYQDTRVSSLSRWQYLQKLKQDYWARWSSEYINELQLRGKWYKNKLDIHPGMLVVLKEDNVAPQQWRLGRIIRTHPGDDNVVRVVTVKTADGELTRGVNKVAFLPVEQ